MAFARATRLDQLPPYLFIEIDRKKEAAVAAGKDVIDFGVGDPDRPTPTFVIDRMAEAIRDAGNHPYAPGTGSRDFRVAVARFMQHRFGVSVDPSNEVTSLLGSKEGIGHLPLAVLNPGDLALIPTPGYPVYESGTIFAGGVPYFMPLAPRLGFLPLLEEIPSDVLDRATLMYLNYPNNPTGGVAPPAFYERCVELARKHEFIICSDTAYTELYFDDNHRPHSILETAGAKDVSIEFHSLSKTFNMTGWRVAFAVGQPDVLAALGKIKGNLDSGTFGAIQDAAIAALDGIDRQEVSAIRRLYRERCEMLVPPLREIGFEIEPPRATFYIWARCPRGYDSMTCATRMLEEAAIVAIPGIGFGKGGEQYVRFALTVERERIGEATKRLKGMTW